MAMTRDRFRELLDAVPDERLTDAAMALEPLVDPLLAVLLNAPLDDESLTDEDRAAIAEGEADVERGNVVRWEDYDPDSRARA